MTRGLIGVAISTTGDDHRLDLLGRCVAAWRKALPLGSVIAVTVDGTEEEAERVGWVVDASAADGHVGGNTWRVGQPRWGVSPYNGRMGVAVNKNTGIELLMDAGVKHLFLSDDDTWPKFPQALDKHIDWAQPHSMVCWGFSRLERVGQAFAEWKWPRGVLLYQTREVVERVGGMDERFGPGGHEHVEYSQRIHNAGLTPAPFVTPASYAETGPAGRATRASALWHAEDMRRKGESSAALDARRRRLTSINRAARDWDQIHKIMGEREGSDDYVPFRASVNGRGPATLVSGRSHGGEK